MLAFHGCAERRSDYPETSLHVHTQARFVHMACEHRCARSPSKVAIAQTLHSLFTASSLNSRLTFLRSILASGSETLSRYPPNRVQFSNYR
jgi:hypothetical protein